MAQAQRVERQPHSAGEVPHPPIVSQQQWLAARKKLLTHEKELTKQYDRMTAERRRLPMVKIEKDYEFDGPAGKVVPSLDPCGCQLEILFGKLTELIWDGTGKSQRRSIFDRLPSEAVADLVDGDIGRPTHHPSLGARSALFIVKPKWKFQLHIPLRFEVRHGYRQQRNCPLSRMVRERHADELLGNFGKDRGR
jgi:hypothetical protein